MGATQGGGRRQRPRPFGLGWWVVSVTLGLLLGLFVPALALGVTVALELPPWATYPTVALAGFGMGLVLGIAQGSALHGTVLEVPRAAWALATAAGALVSWSIGLLPVTLVALDEPLPRSTAGLVAGVAGLVVVLLAVPFLQWLLLRRVTAGAWRWLPVCVLAGVVGVLIGWLLVQATGLGSGDLRPETAVAVAAVPALAAATVTGLGLRWLAPATA